MASPCPRTSSLEVGHQSLAFLPTYLHNLLLSDREVDLDKEKSLASVPPNYNTTGMPMGFAAQIKALQDTQREQGERIASLERENTGLKAAKDHNLLARIEALEQHNQHLTARRKEAVAQLLNLRTLHQEANNAFHLRSMDIQPDDLEGVLAVYGTSVTSVVNHHQRALALLSAGGQSAQMLTYGAAAHQAHHAGQNHHPIVSAPICYAYPVAYAQTGYCLAHSMPYPCRVCER